MSFQLERSVNNYSQEEVEPRIVARGHSDAEDTQVTENNRMENRLGLDIATFPETKGNESNTQQ